MTATQAVEGTLTTFVDQLAHGLTGCNSNHCSKSPTAAYNGAIALLVHRSLGEKKAAVSAYRQVEVTWGLAELYQPTVSTDPPNSLGRKVFIFSLRYW